LEEFKSIDHNFPISRECEFIEKLAEVCLLWHCTIKIFITNIDDLWFVTFKALRNNNSEEYAQACFDFDQITPLDAWKTDILLQAKKHILADDETDIS
jgi:hypothetical protein